LEDSRDAIEAKDAALVGVTQADAELSAELSTPATRRDELNHEGNLVDGFRPRDQRSVAPSNSARAIN
jgi:hypothetical protein